MAQPPQSAGGVTSHLSAHPCYQHSLMTLNLSCSPDRREKAPFFFLLPPPPPLSLPCWPQKAIPVSSRVPARDSGGPINSGLCGHSSIPSLLASGHTQLSGPQLRFQKDSYWKATITGTKDNIAEISPGLQHIVLIPVDFQTATVSPEIGPRS